TVIATQKLDDKDKQVGIFFDRNRLGSIGCDPPRWVSNNDKSLRVEYGARGFCSLSECTRGAPIPPFYEANSLACVRYTSPPIKRYALYAYPRAKLNKDFR
ncbi:MAG: hypothetical protein BECKG1743F_GA0114225_108443, partial [Candidatus Kentron sp. G]